MERVKPIWIVCPQHRLAVRGTYDVREPANGPSLKLGEFDLAHVQCHQHEGRCAQTLCVLHRYNRRGPGSWYPQVIMAIPDCNPPQQGEV